MAPLPTAEMTVSKPGLVRRGRRDAARDIIPSYAFFTSSSFVTSPTKISTPWDFRDSISLAFCVTVFWEVRMAIRPKLALAAMICSVIYFPMAPVAPMMRMLEGILVYLKAVIGN